MKSDKGTEKKGFMEWYESYQGKKVVGAVYSLGASVVIIGALFKIMHFPGAGAMLMVGMGIEALLFALGCLDKPHTEFHWNNVFPQLIGHGADPELVEEMKKRPCPTLMGGAGGGSAAGAGDVTTANAGAAASVSEGLASLAKTAEQLKELGAVASAATNLVGKLDAAGQTAEQFVAAGKVMNEKTAELGSAYAQVSVDMQKVAAETKNCESQVASVSAHLQQLNAVYELQLNTLQAQVDAYKQQTAKVVDATAKVDALTASVQTISNVTAEALKSHEAYAAGTKQLASQVADLNKVYGNMLNAL